MLTNQQVVLMGLRSVLIAFEIICLFLTYDELKSILEPKNTSMILSVYIGT